MPGNVTVTAGGGLISVIAVADSIVQEPIFMGDILYQYANLDLPFSPNDPGLAYTYNNTAAAAHVTLAARFFNLIDEDSTGVFVDVGFASVYTGVSGGMLTGCLDVRLFGAVGNGIADDTLAVQAALNQASKNYQALVATGAAGTPGVPLSASGIQLYPDSVGVPGPLGSTIVCIPSGVYCRVFPRTWDFANINTPPNDGVAAQYPPDCTGLCALFIDDGVSLEIDGGVILGFDLAVLQLQAQTNLALAGDSYADTMWVLENKYAFTNGPYGPGQTANAQPWEYSIDTWEIGPRNQGIQVFGTGFIDCGGSANTTEFQTGGWLNECRGGGIRFCKCDQSVITQITVQNFVSNQGVYCGHGINTNTFDVNFQNSYGGAVFANHGTQGLPPEVSSSPAVVTVQLAGGTGPFTGTTLVLHSFTNFTGPLVLLVPWVSSYIGGGLGSPTHAMTVLSVEDNVGNSYTDSVAAQDMNQFGTAHGDQKFGMFSLNLPGGIPSGYQVTVTVDIPFDPVTGYWGLSVPFIACLNCTDLSDVDGGVVNGSHSFSGPSITTEASRIIVTASTVTSVVYPSIAGYCGIFNTNGDPGINVYSYGNSCPVGTFAPAGTYTPDWTSPSSYVQAGIAVAALVPVTSGVVAGFPGEVPSINSDFRFFALVYDVMRQGAVYANRFTNVNAAIGEFACFHTDFHDNIAGQCGLPPYGTHFATDRSLLFAWTVPTQLNVDGNRYANHYSMNKDLVWTPGMWITDGSDLRTMTPTGGPAGANSYQVGNHIWLALPKGLSLFPGPAPDNYFEPPGYPYYAGVTGPTEPSWIAPAGTLEINPTFGGASGPWPYVLDAVVPVTGAFVGFWFQGVTDPDAEFGPYFSLPTSDPGWGNHLGMDDGTGASTVTVFKNGIPLVMGVDWFPGLDGANNPDFIQFSASFTASDFDVITVNMDTQICWVDLTAVNINCPWVPTCFYPFGGAGSGNEMQGYRMLSNQVSDNYMDGIGYSGLASGQISHSQVLRNTGYGIIDLTEKAEEPIGTIPSTNISAIDNYAKDNGCDDLTIPLLTAGILDNAQVVPEAITRGGVTQTFYNIVPNEIPAGVINGTNVTFTLAHTPVAGTLQLVENGVLQDIPDEYSIAGNVITFVIAPTVGSSMSASYQWA